MIEPDPRSGFTLSLGSGTILPMVDERDPVSGKPATPEPVSFPRGGAGPPQALPKGAHGLLVVVSIVALGGTLALLWWVLGI